MEPKIFSLAEANHLIPRIRELLQKLRMLREKIEAQKLEMDLLEIVGVPRQGIVVDTGMTKEMSSLNDMAGEFNKCLEELEDMGCQVKDLDQGLVDFFSVREGQLIYLCWKEGEDVVQYWHTLDGGFQGRKPI
ncbi:MAG: DUF2203 domain-containing protein [Candidatus Omnitrophica bacterium]|nr:DUF2203 domain-containing protein [Candidatus Omnitrophota bacterium]